MNSQPATWSQRIYPSNGLDLSWRSLKDEQPPLFANVQVTNGTLVTERQLQRAGPWRGNAGLRWVVVGRADGEPFEFFSHWMPKVNPP